MWNFDNKHVISKRWYGAGANLRPPRLWGMRRRQRANNVLHEVLRLLGMAILHQFLGYKNRKKTQKDQKAKTKRKNTKSTKQNKRKKKTKKPKTKKHAKSTKQRQKKTQKPKNQKNKTKQQQAISLGHRYEVRRSIAEKNSIRQTEATQDKMVFSLAVESYCCCSFFYALYRASCV